MSRDVDDATIAAELSAAITNCRELRAALLSTSSSLQYRRLASKLEEFERMLLEVPYVNHPFKEEADRRISDMLALLHAAQLPVRKQLATHVATQGNRWLRRLVGAHGRREFSLEMESLVFFLRDHRDLVRAYSVLPKLCNHSPIVRSGKGHAHVQSQLKTSLQTLCAVYAACNLSDMKRDINWDASLARYPPTPSASYIAPIFLRFGGDRWETSLRMECVFSQDAAGEWGAVLEPAGDLEGMAELGALLTAGIDVPNGMAKLTAKLQQSDIPSNPALWCGRSSCRCLRRHVPPSPASIPLQRLSIIGNVRIPVKLLRAQNETRMRLLRDAAAIRVLLYTTRNAALVQLHTLLVERERDPLEVFDILADLSQCRTVGSHLNCLTLSNFLELYLQCTGAAFDCSCLQVDDRAVLAANISLRGSVNSSFADHPAMVDCIFRRDVDNVDHWVVQLRVANGMKSQPFEMTLATLVHRKNTGDLSCNCDRGICHISHQGELWRFGDRVSDLLRRIHLFAPAVGEMKRSTITGSSHGIEEFAMSLCRGQMATLRLFPTARIAQGANGRVILGDLHAAGYAERVVVKISPAFPSDATRELIRREIDVWFSLDFPRILPFYGSVEFTLEQIGLVSPFMSNGNMAQFLFTSAAPDRLRLIKEVAEGLVYLHEVARIAHGDLKCENVLISDQCSALIADFGLSTWIDGGENPTCTDIRSRNTLRFASPELLMDEAFPTPSHGAADSPRSKTVYSDVYAFGRLIYQAYTGAPPWPRLPVPQVIINVVQGRLPPRVRAGFAHPPLSDALWALCERCWARNPASRPTAAEALRLMAEMCQTVHADRTPAHYVS